MARPERGMKAVSCAPVETNRFVFLLMHGFSALELGSGTDSLAAANETLGRELFQWETASETGDSVASSSGLTVAVDGALPEVQRGEFVVVCCAFNSQIHRKSGKAVAWLRRAARQGARLCGVGGGALFLARIGIASEGRISAHWKMKPVFEERYLNLDPACTVFEMTSDIVSCGGGAATLDLFLELIRQKAGPETSDRVADQLLCGSVRDGHCRQSNSSLSGMKNRNEKLSKAIANIQEYLDEPVSPSIIASQVGISTRQLERLFRRYLGVSPKTYMMTLRLERARTLLQQTPMPAIDVATACGFSTQSLFSKRYKQHFGKSPCDERVVLAR